MKLTLRCKTLAKAQVNYRKHQRTRMNRLDRRQTKQVCPNE